jgi:hypothetical protein
MAVVLSLVKPPSARELKIYARLVKEHAPPGEVAREFGLSPPAVARIHRRVAIYLAETDGDIWRFAEDAALAAHQDYVQTVDSAVHCAYGLLQQSLHPENGQPPRPCGALLSTLVRMCKTLRDARVEAAEVGAQRAEAMKKDPRRLEELLVRETEQMCRDVREYVKRQSRCGLAALNLPHDTRQDRRTHVQNAYRTTQNTDALSLLPAAWQRAYRWAFIDPQETPPIAPEKQEYKSAENGEYSAVSEVAISDVNTDKTATCAAPAAVEPAPQTHSIPRNMLPPSVGPKAALDELAVDDAIAAALDRRKRQHDLAKARSRRR